MIAGAEQTHSDPDRLAPDPLVSVIGRPLLPATIALTGGILSYGSGWGLAVSAAAAIIAIWSSRTRIMRALAALTIGFWCLGIARAALSSGPGPADISRWIGRGYVTIRGIAASDPEVSRRFASLFLRVDQVQDPDGMVHSSSGTVSLRVPDALLPLEFGDGLEVRGVLQRPGGGDNPGLFHYPEYLARMGVYSAMKVKRPSAAQRFLAESAWGDLLNRRIQQVRVSLISSFDRSLPPIEANLLAGIVLGQRTRLPAQLKDDFAASGTTHILASSGMNVGIVAAFAFFLARLCRIRRSRAVFPVILALALYTLLAGAKPSVVRADIMATVFLFAYAVHREPDMPSAVSLAALILLLWDPGAVYDPGFQLSFASVIALVVCMPLMEPILRSVGGVGRKAPLSMRIGHALLGGIVVSLVAQVATVPLTAQHFNQVSLLGIPANALIVLAVPPLLYGGLALWAAAMLWAPAAAVLASILSVFSAYVLGVARVCGSSPFSVVNVPSPGWAFAALYYFLLGWLIWRLRVRMAGRDEGPA